MTLDENDMRAFSRALAEMNHLNLFDRDGAHAESWAAIRSAGFSHTLERQCTWPNCDVRPVYSHTIAAGFGLAPLAVGGHVMMPKPFPRPMQMKREGLGKATTFPGYCDKHEQKFGVFESLGKLTTLEHVALQLFRSTSREIWNKRRWFDYFDQIQRQYSSVLIDNRTHEVPGGLADRVLRPIENLMARTREEIELLFALWHMCWAVSGIEGDPQLGSHPDAFRRFDITTSRKVALSGSTFLDVVDENDGLSKRLPVVLTMLPTSTGVDCMFVTIPGIAAQYETGVQGRVSREGGDSIVDQWLVATDWWCANPDWWKTSEASWRSSILLGLDSF